MKFWRLFRSKFVLICPKCNILLDYFEMEDKRFVMAQCNFCKINVYLGNVDKKRAKAEGNF